MTEGTACRCKASELENNLLRELEEGQRSWSRVTKGDGSRDGERGHGAEQAGPCRSGKDGGYFILKTGRSQGRVLNWEHHSLSKGSRN